MSDESQPPVPTSLTPPEGVNVMVPLCAVFRKHLKSQDLKYTRERADILNTIIETDDVFEAESLLEELSQRGHRSSKATVYRTLKLLQDAGIITPVMIDTRQTHYHLVYGREPLNFLVCLRTGKQIRISDERTEALRDAICAEHGWHPVAHRMVIYGISPDAEDGDASS